MKSKTKKSYPKSGSQSIPSGTNHLALPIEALRWQCDPASLGVKSSDDIKPSREIIGQERALRALRVGLEMKHFGYNIFVTGISGTGRTTTIKRLLSEFEDKNNELKDHCYVYNFKNPDMPVSLQLPAGQGKSLKEDMVNLIDGFLRDISALYESQRYQAARKTVVQHFQDRQKAILQDFEKRVKEQGFELVQVQVGQLMRPDIVPVVGGNPTNIDQVEALIEKGEVKKEDYERMRSTQDVLEKQMALVFRELRNIEQRVQESLGELDEKHVMPVVTEAIEVLKATYSHPKVLQYLEDVKENVMDNLDRFRRAQQPAVVGDNNDGEEQQDEFVEFQVNVLVDNSETEQTPIIVETNPKYKNIFGTIERVQEKGGIWRTDFTQIKAGSLLRADGGYLVLNALDVLMEPWVWQDLKRTLRTEKMEIHTYEQSFGLAPTGMKPQAIELNVKVIMIGESEIYHLLYSRDDDFKKIFKVRADFDFEMSKNGDAVSKYLNFTKMVCDDEKLKSFDASALAKVVEFGVRLAGRQKKISTRFNIIADVVREANYWATKDNLQRVERRHVERAVQERIYRVNLIEEKIQELINDGTFMIDTDGSVVGQLNGLSVYDVGEHAFGKPSRITAKTSLGRAGIINIEREAELSGPTHNKGVAIISGYLRSKFAQDKPLIVSASITFEQSYGGVDGDSASSTEIYAILSSLSGIPLRQDIAVTGSVNQKGEIQPIGGVNLKIEGFYDSCNARGLTGKQGVLVPKQNVPDLMLREDVVEAVKQGKFAVYAIATIEEGVEILTGTKAATVFQRADKQLQQYASEWQRFEAGKG
ncbi:MAG: AAA family ATPase [Ignavibacteriae bacterium]|nr:AAA family ATPase [Ignavibacteriota bacterium]